MTPGDSVRVTIGGRVYGATVVYVRGGSVRLDFDGKRKRKPMTLPADRCTPAKRTVVEAVVEQTGETVLGVEPRPRMLRDVAELLAPRPVPKPRPPWRSSAYMAHVRTFPCLIAFARAEEAHHHGPHAMGRKGPDWTCIPLTHEVHDHFHMKGMLPGMTREQTDARAVKAQIECMTAWCEARGLDYMTAVRDALARVVEGDG